MVVTSGYDLFNAGRYFASITRLRKSLQLDSRVQLSEPDTTFQLSCQLLGACLEREGRHDEAVTEYLRMIPESARNAEITHALREAYAQSGMNGFWRSFADFAPELSERRVIAPLDPTSLRRSVLSIARGQWKDRNSVGVTCCPTAFRPLARIAKRSLLRSDESLGSAILSRGHSYGVTAPISGTSQPLSTLRMNDPQTERVGGFYLSLHAMRASANPQPAGCGIIGLALFVRKTRIELRCEPSSLGARRIANECRYSGIDVGTAEMIALQARTLIA